MLCLDSKILFAGIENCGKTAIVNLIRDGTLDKNKIKNLKPTKGRTIHSISRSNFKKEKSVSYYIWDLSGVLFYRERWLKTADITFSDTKELIFLIDIQDASNYEKSLCYLSEIIKSEEIRGVVDFEFKLFILFHKADPQIMDSSDIIRNVKFLTQKIKDLNIPFEYEIHITSIYNFEKNLTKLGDNSEEQLELGSLIVKLLS